jgi:hypothetical protein
MNIIVLVFAFTSRLPRLSRAASYAPQHLKLVFAPSEEYSESTGSTVLRVQAVDGYDGNQVNLKACLLLRRVLLFA